MFDGDNHSDGKGLGKYKDMEGKDGLLRNLKTSETVPFPYSIHRLD
jgi:hypothetical protein